jgi:hypothetical protein
MFIEMDWSQAVREQGRLSDDAARRPDPGAGARLPPARRVLCQERRGLQQGLRGCLR